MKVYILSGTTGEYDGIQEWIVSAYKSRRQAMKICKQYNAECKVLRSKYEYRWDIPESEYPEPKFETDYTGTWYEIEEIDLI